MLAMPTTANLTSPPMGSRPEPGMLDSDGCIRPEDFPGWLEMVHACGWTWKRIARELGCWERDVYVWRAGTHTPSRTVRRLAWRALWGPLEAEVNGWTQPRHAALQRPTEASRIKGGGGADGSATRKGADKLTMRVDSQGSPSSPPPSLDPLILEAMKEYGVDEDTARAMLEGA